MNENKFVYIGGDIMTKGSQMQREAEKNAIKELGFDFYNPQDNKEINDKKNLDNNEGLAEKIVKADTVQIRNADIVIIEPQPFALGTMVEFGQIKGMKDIAKDIMKVIRGENGRTYHDSAEMLDDIVSIVSPIEQQIVFPHYEDMRRFNGVVEEGDRRSLGINQYVYGVALDLTDGVGFYEWDEIVGIMGDMKSEEEYEYVSEDPMDI